jgi:hypothetical protein
MILLVAVELGGRLPMGGYRLLPAASGALERNIGA